MLTKAKTASIPDPMFHSLSMTDSITSDIREPQIIKEALSKEHWVEAMYEELHALRFNDTWQLVPRRSHMNIAGSRWVYKTKLKADGSVERFKARLITKGYNQIEEVDFDDTFSPMIKATTISIVLVISMTLHWPIKQLDVKNAFLHGDLIERVFMEHLGFIDPLFPSHVCRLKKALSGLKQAPKAWFHKFSTHIIHLGFN